MYIHKIYRIHSAYIYVYLRMCVCMSVAFMVCLSRFKRGRNDLFANSEYFSDQVLTVVEDVYYV